MSDLSTSSINPSPSHAAAPAVQVVEQHVNVLASLSSQTRGMVAQDPIIIQEDRDYEDLKIRVFSNLM